MYGEAEQGMESMALGLYNSTTATGATEVIYLPTASGPMPIAALVRGVKYAIHSDHLNTPRRLIQTDGKVAWQWVTSAFGEVPPTTGKTRFVSPKVNPATTGTTTLTAFDLRYPGQVEDSESGLFYNHNRFYDPVTGRYLQADPIGLNGGWNRFGYVDANPLSFIDPPGLKKVILLDPRDPAYSAALDYPDDVGKCIVISHGSRTSVNGMRAIELNKVLDRNGCGDMPIKLNSCYAGAGDNSIASDLARIRRTTVIGPNTPIWTNLNDRAFHPVSNNSGSIFYQIPNISRPGQWTNFGVVK